jgi:hypothetical protein
MISLPISERGHCFRSFSLPDVQRDMVGGARRSRRFTPGFWNVSAPQGEAWRRTAFALDINGRDHSAEEAVKHARRPFSSSLNAWPLP